MQASYETYGASTPRSPFQSPAGPYPPERKSSLDRQRLLSHSEAGPLGQVFQSSLNSRQGTGTYLDPLHENPLPRLSAASRHKDEFRKSVTNVAAPPKPVLWPRPAFEANPFHDRVAPRICNWPSPDHRKTTEPTSPSRFRDAFGIGYASPEDESDDEWDLDGLLANARAKALSAAKKAARARRAKARRAAMQAPPVASYLFSGFPIETAPAPAPAGADSDSGAETGALRRAPSPPRLLGSFANLKSWGEPLPPDPSGHGDAAQSLDETDGQIVPWHAPEQGWEQQQRAENELERVRREHGHAADGTLSGEEPSQAPHGHLELAVQHPLGEDEDLAGSPEPHARRHGANNLRVNTPPPPRPPPEPRMPKGYSLRAMASEPAGVGGHHRAATSHAVGLTGSLSARGFPSSASLGGKGGLTPSASQPAVGLSGTAAARTGSAGLFLRRGITAAELNLLQAIKSERSVPGGIGAELSGSPPPHGAAAAPTGGVHLPPLHLHRAVNTHAIVSRLSALSLAPGKDGQVATRRAAGGTDRDLSPLRGVQWGADVAAGSPLGGHLSPGGNESDSHTESGLSHRARVTKASTKNIQSLLARSAVTVNKVHADPVKHSSPPKMKIRKAAQEADQEKTADGAASVAGDGATEGGEAERAPDGAKRASMEAEDDGDGKKKKKKSAQPGPGKKGHRIGNAGAALSRLAGGMDSKSPFAVASSGADRSKKHAHRLTVVLFSAATRSHASESAFRLILPLLRPGVDCLHLVNLALEPWKMLEGHQFVQELASVAMDRDIIVKCHVLQAANPTPSGLAAEAGLVAMDLRADLAVVGSEALTERLAAAVAMRENQSSFAAALANAIALPLLIVKPRAENMSRSVQQPKDTSQQGQQGEQASISGSIAATMAVTMSGAAGGAHGGAAHGGALHGAQPGRAATMRGRPGGHGHGHGHGQHTQQMVAQEQVTGLNTLDMDTEFFARGVRTFVSTQSGPAGRSMMRVVSLLLRPLNDVLMMAPHSELEVPHSEVIAKAAAAAAKREEAEKRALAAGISLRDMPKNILADEEEETIKLDPAAQVAVNAANSAMLGPSAWVARGHGHHVIERLPVGRGPMPLLNTIHREAIDIVVLHAPSGPPGRRPPPIPEGMMQLVYLSSCSVLLFREDAFSQLRHVGADKFGGDKK